MNSDLFTWGIYLIAGAIWLLGSIEIYRVKKQKTTGPIMSSSGLLSSVSLTSMHKGEIEGFEYNFIVGSDGRIIALVQLHHNTKLHMIAIGDKSKLGWRFQNSQLSKRLAKVQLEGDFPKYFSMYCTPGRELELLHVFDPADMARFVDFCRSHDFELFNDTIYMSQAHDTHDENDTTTLIEDVETFVKRNKGLLHRLKAI